MKLFYSPASPFVRKVVVCAIELGLDESIERLPSAAHPVNRDPRIVSRNPLGQVPTLLTDEGEVLFDSRVICEYLDSRAPERGLFPSGARRFGALRDQALGDGILDAALLVRYENATHDEGARSAAWVAGQLDKVEQSLRFLEERVDGFANRVDIGAITVGCALGYLDFRFDDLAWRASCPGLARWFEAFGGRQSMRATTPQVRPA
jgi:glutathione S-transferase